MLTLGEAPDPVAGPGETVIAVSAADVLFLDTQIRSGSVREAGADAVAGKIKRVVGQTFPLPQPAAAHAAMEARCVIGKSLLLI